MHGGFLCSLSLCLPVVVSKVVHVKAERIFAPGLLNPYFVLKTSCEKEEGKEVAACLATSLLCIAG